MNNHGEIVVIEDDEDDRFIIEEVLKILECPNNRVYFNDGRSAMDYLQNPECHPFIVFSDKSLLTLSNLEVRRELRADRVFDSKCIPFVLFSTDIHENLAVEAHSSCDQGVFIKAHSIPEFTRTIRTIIEYWQRCSPAN